MEQENAVRLEAFLGDFPAVRFGADNSDDLPALDLQPPPLYGPLDCGAGDAQGLRGFRDAVVSLAFDRFHCGAAQARLELQSEMYLIDMLRTRR